MLLWSYGSKSECCCQESPPSALQHKCEASSCHKSENILFECSFISLQLSHVRRHACNRCRRSFVCVARRAEQARWGLSDPTRRPGANAGALRQGAQSLRHDHAFKVCFTCLFDVLWPKLWPKLQYASRRSFCACSETNLLSFFHRLISLIFMSGTPHNRSGLAE